MTNNKDALDFDEFFNRALRNFDHQGLSSIFGYNRDDFVRFQKALQQRDEYKTALENIRMRRILE